MYACVASPEYMFVHHTAVESQDYRRHVLAMVGFDRSDNNTSLSLSLSLSQTDADTRITRSDKYVINRIAYGRIGIITTLHENPHLTYPNNTKERSIVQSVGATGAAARWPPLITPG